MHKDANCIAMKRMWILCVCMCLCINIWMPCWVFFNALKRHHFSRLYVKTFCMQNTSYRYFYNLCCCCCFTSRNKFVILLLHFVWTLCQCIFFLCLSLLYLVCTPFFLECVLKTFIQIVVDVVTICSFYYANGQNW